jgi:hypothetical protein
MPASQSPPLGNDNDNKKTTLSGHFDNALESVKKWLGSTPAPTTTPAAAPANPNQTVTAGGRKTRRGKSRKCSKCTRARKCARCRKSRRGKSRKCSKCTRARKCARCRKSSRR